MLKIIVDENHEHYEAEGQTIEIIAELLVGVENVVKSLVKDAPSDILPAVKGIIKETLNVAIEQAFK